MELAPRQKYTLRIILEHLEGNMNETTPTETTPNRRLPKGVSGTAPPKEENLPTSESLANGTTEPAKAKRREPDPEFRLLHRIDAALCEVDEAVGDRVLAMLCARRFGIALKLGEQQ
jgi:hypothetical protein